MRATATDVRPTSPRASERAAIDDSALAQALDPALGVFASVESLAAGDPTLPVAVRGRLVGPVFAWPREVHGRGADAGDALVSVVSAALEQFGKDGLAGKRVVPAIRMGLGSRATIDAATVLARGAVGCSAELAGAGEHGALEAWERRATARAWVAGQDEARLDEGGEPPAIGRVLDWHRGRGRRVISLLLDRTPPVVACVALPHDPDAPALVGVAAGRTLAAAWRGAALELHQVHLARCLGARTGDLRGRHGRLTAGRVMGVARDHAIDRAALAALVAATRRSIAPSTVPSYAPHLDALAVDITPPIAERLGRKVVAVVLGGE